MKKMTREEALARGGKRYNTGEPCIHGHTAPRLVSNRCCVACSHKRAIAWAASNPERINARVRHRRASQPEKMRKYDRDRYRMDPRAKMLSAAKKRAALKGVPFDLGLGDIAIPEICPLLGVTLAVGAKTICDASPSLDRIHNDAGYVRGNIIVVSYAANRAKGALCADQLLKLALNLKELESL